MQHLRIFKHYVIWIDAICINQNDISERNDQILRMKSVYHSARRAVAFLGSESEDSALAVEKMELRALYARNKDKPPYEYIFWENPEIL